ncbi:GNAT family N-acetyltransferase [Rossellomorea sp. H39__3]
MAIYLQGDRIRPVSGFLVSGREEGEVEGILSEDHHTLVCTTKDGLVVGFASVGRERSGEYEGELYAIYLLREYQGRGIGRELFSRSISSLKALGFQDMFIWVLRRIHPKRSTIPIRLKWLKKSRSS